MEIFNKLDVVEILKFGAIGLGFLLAFLAFLIIRKEQERESPSKTVLNITKFFMVFSLIIVLLGILSEFSAPFQTLAIKLGSDELKISELTTKSVSDLNASEYYINSEVGFAFKKPKANWSEIKSSSGISAILKLNGIKSKYLTEDILIARFNNHPFGNFFKAGRYIFFENPKSKVSIKVTPRSGSEEIDATLKQISAGLLDTNDWMSYDTTYQDEKEEYLEEMLEYRKQLLGFDELESKEAFVVSAFPKDSLPAFKKNMQLPAFFTSLSAVFGSNTDKLVATEKQILTGTEMKLNNVLVNNALSTYINKKWYLFTQNDNYFFLIEISYPPQLSESINRWDELQEILNSFTILK